mmetsp:Transcript_14545/g.23953  ORF Transcript_14545/g.23953 Transcript_14545/m.23953 type:complete len:231 (-) Transcript_14545:454-1146(-)
MLLQHLLHVLHEEDLPPPEAVHQHLHLVHHWPDHEVRGKVYPNHGHAHAARQLHVHQRQGDGDPLPPSQHLVKARVARVVELLLVTLEPELLEHVPPDRFERSQREPVRGIGRQGLLKVGGEFGDLHLCVFHALEVRPAVHRDVHGRSQEVDLVVGLAELLGKEHLAPSLRRQQCKEVVQLVQHNLVGDGVVVPRDLPLPIQVPAVTAPGAVSYGFSLPGLSCLGAGGGG